MQALALDQTFVAVSTLNCSLFTLRQRSTSSLFISSVVPAHDPARPLARVILACIVCALNDAIARARNMPDPEGGDNDDNGDSDMDTTVDRSEDGDRAEDDDNEDMDGSDDIEGDEDGYGGEDENNEGMDGHDDAEGDEDIDDEEDMYWGEDADWDEFRDSAEYVDEIGKSDKAEDQGLSGRRSGTSNRRSPPDETDHRLELGKGLGEAFPVCDFLFQSIPCD